MCCQGYLGKCCCIDPREICKGKIEGLILEGMCCPMLSLSFARLHLMAMKRVRPDPVGAEHTEQGTNKRPITTMQPCPGASQPRLVRAHEGCCLCVRRRVCSTRARAQLTTDYQLIACSNFLQLASCVLDIVAIFFSPAREAAHILDLAADCFTFSVAGCMGAQIYHEINKDNAAGEIVYVVVEGIPVVDGQAAAVGGAGLAAQDGAQTAQVVAIVPETMERQRMNSVSEAVPEHELRMSQSNASGAPEKGGAPTVNEMSR